MTGVPRAAGRVLAALAGGLLATLAIGAVGAAGQAGEERIYVDVNQPRVENTSELAAAAELAVIGEVTGSASGPEGALLRVVHRVDVAETLLGEHRALVEVVQDLGSVDGRVHVGGQRLLRQGEPFLLFLEVDGERYRTVGGAQGVFVPTVSGWVSAAPSREDLTLPEHGGGTPVIPDPGGAPAPTGVGPGEPDEATRTGVPTADASATTATLPAAATPAATPSVVESPPVDALGGREAWLLAPAFLGGLVLGGVTTFGVTRRRRAAPALQRSGQSDRPGQQAQPGPGGAEAAAVRGLIAVGDAIDSAVVQAQVQRSLRQAGIEMIPAEEGDVFDTRLHHGVGWHPAPRPDLHLRVARVVRPGWRMAGGVLRPADVEVYRDVAQ